MTAQRLRRRLLDYRRNRGAHAYERGDYSTAYRYLKRAATDGDPDAQYQVGLLYARGHGVQRHPPDAVYWFTRAAEQGVVEAQFQLSLAYLRGQPGLHEDWYQNAKSHDPEAASRIRDVFFPHGLSVPVDYTEAFRWALLAARAGRADAQATLGSLYLRGLGCSQDYLEARRWYEGAAAEGDADAQYGLGVIYANGLGVPVDLALAAEWYRAAAGSGHGAAGTALALMHIAARGVSHDPGHAAILFSKAADQDDPRARHNLGLLHLRGEGVPLDLHSAERCFRSAAHQGYVPAMLSLAQLYIQPGPLQNISEGIVWYRAAAHLGDAQGQFYLGTQYAEGIGVPQQMTEAAKWFFAAAAQGYAPAQFNIAIFYLQGIGIEPDSGKAVEWLRRAAEQDITEAQVTLASLYMNGDIVAANPELAVDWLQRAATLGDAEAMTALALLHLHGSGVPHDRGRAESLLRDAANLGHMPANLHLGYLHTGSDEVEAMRWFLPAAEAGNGEAQSIVGWNYRMGRGCDKNDVAAASWFRKSAELGHAAGQCGLASMLWTGDGIDKDRDEAILWYKKAADAGDAEARRRIAELEMAEDQGNIDPSSDTETMKWFRLAAEQGDPGSQTIVAWDYLTGKNSTKDQAMAVFWFRKAAEAGHVEAQLQLGRMLMAGEGVNRDHDAASFWVRKAAEAGSAEAKSYLSDLQQASGSDAPLEMTSPDPLAIETVSVTNAAVREPVRLVIWDLDDTFWRGTLSESGIKTYIQENHDIVIALARRGIMSAICSKNDFDTVRDVLQRYAIWDYFIFPSIDWTAKGKRVAGIIEAAQLRPETVMFIDDNSINLAEVAAAVAGIQVADPSFLPSILDDHRFKGKDDTGLTRLSQYKLMEQRQAERRAYSNADDTADFLRDSHIQVSIETDITAYIDRAVELINRTNQLNFTKRRLPDESETARARLLTELRPFYVKAALIRVTDKYGDHGYCGFYRMEGDTLLDYCFSCRILGMGVESWLYQRLGRPSIKIVGEVLTDIKQPRMVDWISIVTNEEQKKAHSAPLIPEVRVRGGCDLDALAHYFQLVAHNVRSETNRHRRPLFIRMDSSAQLEPTLIEPDADFNDMISRLGYEPEDFMSRFLSPAEAGSILVYSPWADVYQNIYRHKTKGFRIPLNTVIYGDMTSVTDDEINKIFETEIKGEVDQKNKLREIVDILRSEYIYEPKLEIPIARRIIARIFDHIPAGAHLFVVLPYEWYKDGDTILKRTEAIEYNTEMKALARDYAAVTILPMNDFVFSPEEMQGSFDHFDCIVYFRVYNAIIQSIEKF